MRSPRWRKVLRDVWLHKPRTILVVLAIAIGIVGAGSVLNTWALLRVVVDEGYRATNPASATLWTDSIGPDLLARVRALPAIADAQVRRTVSARALVEGGWRPAMLFAMEDFRANRIGLVRERAGAWPPKAGEIVLEHSSLDLAGAGVGEALTVRYGEAEPQALAVTGIAQDQGLAPGWMEHLIYAFVTPATLARLGAPASLNQLQIVVRDASLDQDAVRRIAFAVKAEIERAGHPVRDVAVPVPFRHIHADQMNSLLYTQAGFGVLALLLSGIMVVNLVTAMLTGQVREIGVMKSLGARRGQLAAMYLALALVLGLAASALALPAAAAIGRAYADFTAGMLNFDTAGYRIPLWAYAVQLAVGALLPVAAALGPVVRGCRIPVSEALRDFGIAERGSGSGGRLLGRAGGLTRPILLSLRNAFRRRQRMVLTLLTLATGGAVYLGALNLRASIRAAVAGMFGAMKYDLAIRFARPYPADSIEAAVARVPGVALAEAWSGGSAAVVRPDGTFGNRFVVSAPPPGSRLQAHLISAGRWLRAGDANALVVNPKFLEDEPSARLGGDVTLTIGGRASRWTVVGVAAGESPVTMSVYAPREAWTAALGVAGVDRALVASASLGKPAQADLRRRLEQELVRVGFDLAGSGLVAESRAVTEDHLLMVAGFLMIMSQLMIVVGGLGLASTMSLAVLERTREIGVLRAIGARHGAIHTMVQVEGLVIGIASWAIAIPLSVPMSLVLGRAFGEIMIRMPLTFVPEISGIFQWLAVVLVVSVVACAWPAFRATRVPTAAALAYE